MASLYVDKKTFNQGLFISAVWSLVAIPTLFSTALWAPAIYQTIGSVGHYAFRPWIYFFPILLIPVLALLLEAGYRNAEAITGFVVGGMLVLALGYMAFFLVPSISFATVKF